MFKESWCLGRESVEKNENYYYYEKFIIFERY